MASLYSPQIQILVFVCPQFSPSLELGSFLLPVWSWVLFRPQFSPSLRFGSFPPPIWSWVLFYPPFSPSLEFGSFPPPVWGSVLFHSQFFPTLELSGCLLSILWEFGVWGLSAPGCLWIWNSGLSALGTAFWDVPSHMGLLPHPSTPQGQKRVGSARTIRVSTQEWLCWDMHGQNPCKRFASVVTFGAQL